MGVILDDRIFILKFFDPVGSSGLKGWVAGCFVAKISQLHEMKQLISLDLSTLLTSLY